MRGVDDFSGWALGPTLCKSRRDGPFVDREPPMHKGLQTGRFYEAWENTLTSGWDLLKSRRDGPFVDREAPPMHKPHRGDPYRNSR